MTKKHDFKEHLVQAAALLTQVMGDEEWLRSVELAADAFIASIQGGGKIISCGNGGSLCDAMHFAEELSGRYRENRRALPALACSDASHMSCVGNDYGYDQVFARFIEALGKPGDVLLAISTSGRSANVVAAAEVARKNGMVVVGLTGKDGGPLAALCDFEVRVPWHGYADRIQEIHIKVIHGWIDAIERAVC
jgi:D-sedoheptulose 7-phosphate isomerase